MTRRPRVPRIVAAAALLTGLLGAGLVLAGPASAHATVVSSDPRDGTRLHAAPAAVTITFDESVGLGKVGYLHVTDQTGRRVDAGAATHPSGDETKVTDRLASGLGDGTYTASFRVVSADSHPVGGTIRFVVGNGALAHGSLGAASGDDSTQAVLDVVKWVSYAGFALLGGAWVLLTVWPEGRDDRRACRVVWSGWAAMLIGGAAELLLQGPYTAGLGPGHLFDGTLIDATLHSDYGQLHSARLLLLGVLGLVFARSLQAGARPARWEWGTGLVAIALAGTFSGAGHPDTTPPAALSIPVDMLHLLAMAAWVGGLVVLVAAVLPRREPAELRAVVPVVSTVAFVSVVVLAGSGTYAAFRGIGTVDAVFTTTYGLLVLSKIALFLAIVAVANVSRRVVHRRLVRPQLAYAMTDAALHEPVDSGTGGSDDTVNAERLRRSVLVEMLVAFVVLGVTAVLVGQPRGKEALVAQYRESVSASEPLSAGRRVELTADPGTHGSVDLRIDVTGGPRLTSVTATATQPDRQIGPVPVRLSRAADRSFDGTVDLPVAGRWRVDLVVSTSAFDAVTTQATVHLH